MRLVRICLILALGGLVAADAQAQRLDGVVPVGVRYQLDPDPMKRRHDLEELRRLRFNVVALSEPADGSADVELGLIDRLLGGAADARVRVSGMAFLSPGDSQSAAAVRLASWYAFSLGARGVIFGEWSALQQNADGLTAAVEFAEHVSRNAGLYAPLRPRVTKENAPDVTIATTDPRISARFLESPDALLLVVANHAVESRDVTLTFSPDMPEAIWQNMLTGAAVNFVARPNGPVYSRTFDPTDVLVLMIRKQLK